MSAHPFASARWSSGDRPQNYQDCRRAQPTKVGRVCQQADHDGCEARRLYIQGFGAISYRRQRTLGIMTKRRGLMPSPPKTWSPIWTAKLTARYHVSFQAGFLLLLGGSSHPAPLRALVTIIRPAPAPRFLKEGNYEYPSDSIILLPTTNPTDSQGKGRLCIASICSSRDQREGAIDRCRLGPPSTPQRQSARMGTLGGRGEGASG